MLFSAVPKAFTGGVGRRILGLFLVAGVLPVMFTAALAYTEFGRAAESKAFLNLERNAKAYGVDILARLNIAEGKARELAAAAQAGLEIDSRSYLLEDFDAIWLNGPAGERQAIHGKPEAAPLTAPVEYGFLESGGTQLIVAADRRRIDFLLTRLVLPEHGERMLMTLRLKPENLWGSPEEIPYSTEFCVLLTSGLPLYCTQQMDESLHRRLTLAEQGDIAHWRKGDVEHVAATWQLFLAGTFRAPAFDIIASQPKEYALQSDTDVRRVFVPAMGLVFILVGLLSFSMIGRSLVPLQRLTRAAQKFARGNLGSRVRISSDDEFGALGRAFNEMAERLGRQIGMLEAMSEIDQLILSGATFEEVCRAVTGHLTRLTSSGTVGVLARNGGADAKPQLIIAHADEVFCEDAELPEQKPSGVRIVELAEAVSGEAVWVRRFMECGQRYVAVIPVLLHDDLKGLLLVGAVRSASLDKNRLRQCMDLASRFAVALSSFERENALYRKANFDDLTALPNRQLLKERLREMVESARGRQQSGALLYLDLDRFKEINDVYGHSVGDIVLTQAAERIVAEIRDSGMVARLGGDEFVVVLPRVESSEAVKAIASHLLTRLTEVFSVFGVNHFVGGSIGIVLFPDDGDSVEVLLKNADAAMYRAKEAGRARYEFFNVKLNAESRRKIELERDLRAAFAEGALEVHYQPQFCLEAESLSGAEALLRWQHPRHGDVSPTEFVPLAEESDLIIDIGRWVIEQTCRDLRQIIDKGLHPGPVSINVSARQLRDAKFVDDVLESLAANDLHPAQLRIEVTETAVAQNPDTAIDLLNVLRGHGIRVAIDDFGTGYSSLSYLQNMPFDVIKIDKSFVERIGIRSTSTNICRTIIKMAHELGKVSVAEGVETRRQLDFLRDAGCDLAQGFFYAEAMAFTDFVAYIRKFDFHTQRRRALEVL